MKFPSLHLEDCWAHRCPKSGAKIFFWKYFVVLFWKHFACMVSISKDEEVVMKRDVPVLWWERLHHARVYQGVHNSVVFVPYSSHRVQASWVFPVLDCFLTAVICCQLFYSYIANLWFWIKSINDFNMLFWGFFVFFFLWEREICCISARLGVLTGQKCLISR